MKKKDIKIITTFNGGYSSTTPNSIQNSPVHYCQPAESQINFKVPSDKSIAIMQKIVAKTYPNELKTLRPSIKESCISKK